MKDYIKQQQAHFDSIAEKYFQERKNEKSVLLKYLMWSHFLGPKSYLKQVTKVLEPMCGFGDGKKILEVHLDKEIEYEGFDYSGNIVEKALENDPRIKIRQGNILDLDSQNTYDMILVIGGLHHVYRHIEIVLDKIFNALKPGGFFLVYEPTHNSVVTKKIRNFIYRRNPLFDYETEQDFNLPTLNRMFQSSGFKIVDQMYPGLLSYILYYNPDAFPALNKGSKKLLATIFKAEKPFYRNVIGRKFSFTTLTLCKK